MLVILFLVSVSVCCFAVNSTNDIQVDGIYTVVKVIGHLPNGRDAGQQQPKICSQVIRSLLRRQNKYVLNTTECKEQESTTDKEQVALIYFLGPALEEHFLYTNKKDFEFYLKDVFKYKREDGDDFNITSISIEHTSKDGLHLRFIHKVLKDSVQVDFEETLSDPTSKNFLKYRSLVTDDFQVIRKNLKEKLAAAYLGFCTLYFYDGDGKALVVTDMYFDFNVLVKMYGGTYGSQVFKDILLTFIEQHSNLRTIGISESTEMQRGSITTIVLTGDLYDGVKRADWNKDLRISDSELYKKFTKEATEYLSDIFKNGGPDFFSALYGYHIHKYSKEGESQVKVAVELLVDQIRLHCKGLPSEKSELKKAVEEKLIEGKTIVGDKVIKDIEVNVTHVGPVPKPIKCPPEWT